MQPHEESLFHEAVEIEDPAARAEFLSRACEGNADLRRRVERLIAVFPKGEALEPIEATAAEVATRDSVREKVGDTIGPFKLLERLGEGGMGVVYMAEQTRPVARKVALKIVKAGMDSAQVIARFEAERQALALMSHPNIAKILDAGETSSGRPYFVMELVRGIPITQFCDQQKFDMRQRLELFVDVCQAVQHAHQKGIIHRDLKPSNLLVELHDVKGVPKVIDFGIAKATNQKLTERTLFTQFSQMVGTPLYMSPEQAQLSGLDVDTRTDIYSLGVLLYELLTGTTPISRDTLSKVGYDELRRRIQNEDSPLPSARVSTLKAEALSTLATNRRSSLQTIRNSLRGELDWIVAKAIEKDRTRRYQSALDFAKDIERYLRGEAVEAHPPSAMYRINKLTRRYKGPVTIAASLMMMLMIATGVSARYAVLADAASKESEERRQEAEDERNEAATQREIAETQSEEAERRRVEAEQLQIQAESQRDEIRRNLYLADMRLSSFDLKNENNPRLQTTLHSYLPEEGQADLRGWEWYYLLSASDQAELTLFGHMGAVVDTAWSPDGRWLATVGSDDGTVIIWDAVTWSPQRWLRGGTSIKRGAAWSPDGRFFAYGDAYSTIRVWSCEADETTVLLGQEGILDLSWSPDGKMLASTSYGFCRVWDIQSRECVETLRCDSTPPMVTWHSSGQKLSIASQFSLIQWDRTSGESRYGVREGYLPLFHCVAYSPDERFLFLGDDYGNCLKYDSETMDLVGMFLAHSGKCSGVRMIDEHRFATCGEDGYVRVWNTDDFQLLNTLPGHSKGVNAIDWSSQRSRLVSVGTDATVRLWNLQNQGEFATIYPADAKGRSADKWSWRFEQLKPISDDNAVSYLQGFAEAMIVPLDNAASPYVRQSRSIFDMRGVPKTVETSEIVQLARLELQRGVGEVPTEEQFLQRHGDTPYPGGSPALFWSPDRMRVAILGGGIEVWDVRVAKRLCGRGPYLTVRDVAWSPDGRMLAYTGREHHGKVIVDLIDAESGELIHRAERFLSGTLESTALVWHPDGTKVAIGFETGEILCWSAETGETLVTSQLFQSEISSLAWSPDGQRIAVAGANQEVKIVDSKTLSELLTLEGPVDAVVQLLWCQEGQSLVGKDSEGRIVRWDASRGFQKSGSSDFMYQRWFEKYSKARDSRQFNIAESCLEEMLKLRPENSLLLVYLGSTRIRQSDYGRAVDALTHYLQRFPDDERELLRRASAYRASGKRAEAIADLSHALDLSTRNSRAQALEERAICYAELENWQESLNDLREGASLAPGHLEFHYHDALISLYLKRHSEYRNACTVLSQQVGENPSSPDRFLFTWTCALGPNAMNDFATVVRYAEQAVELFGAPENRLCLGALYYRSGASEKAIRVLRELVDAELDSAAQDSPVGLSKACAIFFLAMAYHQTGDKESARQWLSKAKTAASEEAEAGEKVWTLKLTLERLEKEAENLIEG